MTADEPDTDRPAQRYCALLVNVVTYPVLIREALQRRGTEEELHFVLTAVASLALAPLAALSLAALLAAPVLLGPFYVFFCVPHLWVMLFALAAAAALLSVGGVYLADNAKYLAWESVPCAVTGVGPWDSSDWAWIVSVRFVEKGHNLTVNTECEWRDSFADPYVGYRGECIYDPHDASAAEIDYAFPWSVTLCTLGFGVVALAQFVVMFLALRQRRRERRAEYGVLSDQLPS